jgi:hypothetical protein
MKLPIRCLAATAFFALLSWSSVLRAQFYGAGVTEESGTLVIRPDGSCSYTNVIGEPRAMAEQQVRMMERFANAGDNSDENPPQPVADTKETQMKPLTDEELIKKLQSMREENEGEPSNPDEQFRVTVTNSIVRMETSGTFASLQDMLAGGSSFWQAGTVFQTARFEQDSDQQIRITLTAPS